MDTDALTREFDANSRSPLWERTDPGALAAWVLGEPDTVAPVESLPDSAVNVATAVKALSEPAAWESLRTLAYSMIGLFTRLSVPAAGATAGRNWIVRHRRHPGFELLRLTVGRPEVVYAEWDEQGLDLVLRIAGSPVDDGLRSGELNSAEMDGLGIERLANRYDTQAGDAARFRCPGPDAAAWFLDQAPVRRASRLMCARLVLEGHALHARNYDAGTAAEAWAAAEVFLDGVPIDGPGGGTPGFDRPYQGRPREGVYPGVMSVGPQAREAAVAEHHALCTRLIEHLRGAGIAAGELRAVPVDLAWRDGRGVQMIAEVKSCLGIDDTAQVRLGLGQVLEYRQRVGAGAEAVLLVGRVPDPLWYAVCAGVGVRLLSGDDEGAWEAALARA